VPSATPRNASAQLAELGPTTADWPAARQDAPDPALFKRACLSIRTIEPGQGRECDADKKKRSSFGRAKDCVVSEEPGCQCHQRWCRCESGLCHAFCHARILDSDSCAEHA
jgi:hypothetical protein